ncbi:MAG: hypothetical protein U0175_18200 [Caldilineaceae bacterium]
MLCQGSIFYFRFSSTVGKPVLEKTIGLFGGLLGIPIFLVYVTVAGSSAVYFLLVPLVMVGAIYGLAQRDWGWFTKVLLLLVLASVLWFMFAPLYYNSATDRWTPDDYRNNTSFSVAV